MFRKNLTPSARTVLTLRSGARSYSHKKLNSIKPSLEGHGKGKLFAKISAALIATGLMASITAKYLSDHTKEDDSSNNLIVQAEEAIQSSPESLVATKSIQPQRETGKKKLVVIGSGWAAVALISQIDLKVYDVYIVSDRNYFLFTPMLPAALVGTVSMQSLVEPVRRIVDREKKKHGSNDAVMQYYEAECFDIDPSLQVVKCRDNSAYVVAHGVEKTRNDFELKYDKLVVAVGAQANSFGVKGVDQYTIPMKEIEHAQKVRERLLDVLESASLPHLTEEERRNALRLVVIGGGPTGVELVGYMYDFIKEDISKLFPKEVVDNIQITMVQSTDHILNMYDKKIVELTEKEFKLNKIDLRTNSRVVEVKENEIVIMDKGGKEPIRIPYGLAIWTTGISQVPLVRSFISRIPAQQNEKSLVVDAFLKVIGVDNVYAIGDCSKINQPQLLKKYESFYTEADTNGDDLLSYEELDVLIKKKEKEYPHFAIINQKLKHLFDKADANKDGFLCRDEFKTLLQQIDNEYYSPLPSTGKCVFSMRLTNYCSTSRQQGRYIPCTQLECRRQRWYEYSTIHIQAYGFFCLHWK